MMFLDCDHYDEIHMLNINVNVNILGLFELMLLLHCKDHGAEVEADQHYRLSSFAINVRTCPGKTCVHEPNLPSPNETSFDYI